MPQRNQDHGAGELSPVKFLRFTRRGILLGLSLSQLITLALGVSSLVWAFYAGGGILIASSAPVWILAAALTWTRIGGRAIVEWIPVACWWVWKSTCGQLLYRRRIVKPRPTGTLALPGDMARLREYTDPVTGAGMVHDPGASTLTAVVSITHPAFVLLDPGEQERRVDSWGRVLATVYRSGRVSMLQVLERTLPDSGTGLAEWWASHGTHDDTWASTTYWPRAAAPALRRCLSCSRSRKRETSGARIKPRRSGTRASRRSRFAVLRTRATSKTSPPSLVSGTSTPTLSRWETTAPAPTSDRFAGCRFFLPTASKPCHLARASCFCVQRRRSSPILHPWLKRADAAALKPDRAEIEALLERRPAADTSDADEPSE